MDLPELYDYVTSLLQEASAPRRSNLPEPFAEVPPPSAADELAMIQLISEARVVLDIIEGEAVHALRSTLPQTSYSDIGAAQGISKQASRIRHTKLDQVLKVHQLDGRRHSLSKAAVSSKHRRAARPVRAERRSQH